MKQALLSFLFIISITLTYAQCLDTVDPTASNPVPINVECIGDVPAPDPLVVTDEADNSGVPPVVSFVNDVSDGNTCPEVITRTYSVADTCANTIMVTQTITIDDLTIPTATNPADLYFFYFYEVPLADPLLITDEADNCTASPVVAFVSDISNGNLCPEIITRTYSVTDDCGNQILLTHDIYIAGVDTSVTQFENVLTATASGMTYQWLDCDNGFAPIPGEVNQVFNATTLGNYACEIEYPGSCTDTSSCYEVTVLGIADQEFSIINIYPNPTNDIININLPGNETHTIQVLSIDGKILKTISTSNQKEIISLEEFGTGFYYIQISSSKDVRLFKIKKN